MTATTCTVVTCRGPRVVMVDDELLRRPTLRYPPGRVRHILAELKVAAVSAR